MFDATILTLEEAKGFARNLFSAAQENLNKDGRLHPMCMTLGRDGIDIIMFMDATRSNAEYEAYKTTWPIQIALSCLKNRAYAVALVMEAWTVEEPTENLGRKPWVPPAERPDRKECVFVHMEGVGSLFSARAMIEREPKTNRAILEPNAADTMHQASDAEFRQGIAYGAKFAVLLPQNCIIYGIPVPEKK